MSPVSTSLQRLRLVGRRVARWRPDWGWVVAVLRSFVVSFLALTLVLWLLPGTQVTRGTISVASLAVGVLAVGALLRPLLTFLTVVTGTIGLLVAGLLAQALVLWVALEVVPTVEPFSVGEIILASWGAAAGAAAINWLFDASSDEAFFGHVLGRAVRVNHRHGRAGTGLVIVQLDGVSEPLLRQGITSGAMPTISTWLRSGRHRLRSWHTGLPATTPAGQSVLLHGDVTSVPSFRWYDKQAGRLVVSSQPADLAAVERSMSTGRGLLADGGVSVSNLFSGDAPTRLLTMSDARLASADRGAASFAVARTGLARSYVLFIGQMITELHQGRRQRRRDVLPRVRRGGSFVLLRGLATVVLRDLNVAMVAEQMSRGADVIFVDFVDYDEVAHHAGPTRPESVRTLEGLDRVLQFFEELSAEIDRDYEIVVVSDHGQSQGMTFRQLTGQTLHDVVAELARQPAREHHDDDPVETWAPANVLLNSASRSDRAMAAAARGALARRPGSGSEAAGEVEPTHPEPGESIVVAAAGSLAHVYLTDLPGRATLEQVEARHPQLVSGLAQNPHVGAVLTRRDDGALLAIGADGWREVEAGRCVRGEGADPLAVYGPMASDDVAGLDQRDHVGDLVVLGAYDPSIDEVVAFEELVGSHGGIGGAQTEALLVHPGGWEVPDAEPLTGLDVHATLLHRLEQLGLRRDQDVDGTGE
ncbi:alkaline phosphatase family protein [Aeromicrobium sp. CTD01-1L150]|uniref:alkaline phosphatase family protein n=1 Tax=Aeromicrobium sp. CTD01-1L150 TaxID=3341830 RepID=UPI0035C037ED